MSDIDFLALARAFMQIHDDNVYRHADFASNLSKSFAAFYDLGKKDANKEYNEILKNPTAVYINSLRGNIDCSKVIVEAKKGHFGPCFESKYESEEDYVHE